MEDTFLPRHIKYVSEGTRYNMLSTGWNTNRTRVETISFVFRINKNSPSISPGETESNKEPELLLGDRFSVNLWDEFGTCAAKL